MAAPIFNSPGGRVQPRPLKPRAPRVPRVKAPNPDQVASQNAMMAFRQALQQLRAVTPAVDSASIYAPYRASEQVTGQLGTGLQQALATSGQAAQDQYTKGLGQAQQQAAQFGISAGAGANPTALQNTGSQLIAQQSQAQQAAAPMAATQWQQLLERAAAAKVSDATLARQNALTGGEQALAGNIPTAIQNEKQLAFQKDTAAKNNAYLYSTLTEKQRQFAAQYGLDALKLKQQGDQNTITNTRDDAKLAAQIAHWDQVDKRALQAQKSGIKNVTQAVSALKGPSTRGSSTKRAAKGWDVTYQVLDPDTGEPTGDTKTLHMPSKKAPPGGKFVSATTHWETVPNVGGTGGEFSWARYKQALGILKASNPGVPVSQLMQILGPTPKTKK